ncbi:DUF234 domain-containing protein [Pyrococcus kukulkanii]|uniref:DUF234 domain-containing protein n=1 Tax=Pyrococcus kukulkanii TaxID=1609559 RepID=UPI0035647279
MPFKGSSRSALRRQRKGFLVELNKAKNYRLGLWWYKSEEVDIVALNEGRGRPCSLK